MTKSAELVWQCHAARLPPPETEYRFWPGRKFAADLAFVEQRLLVEIEGVVYGSADGHLKGRHVSHAGFSRDIEKYAEATAMGWTVLRVLPKHVTSGEALRWIERALEAANRGTLAPQQVGATKRGNAQSPLAQPSREEAARRG